MLWWECHAVDITNIVVQETIIARRSILMCCIQIHLYSSFSVACVKIIVVLEVYLGMVLASPS